MKAARKSAFPVFLLASTCLALLVISEHVPAQSQQSQQSQQPQQPSQGPNPGVGDTVLAPKKTDSTTAKPAPEKKPEKINPNEIFNIRTTTNLVNVDVLVVDKDGNPIPSLGKKNFKVFDDGVPQSVSNFGTGEAPMTVSMLIEFSNKWWGFLYLALRYSYEFVNFIQPNDWVAIVDFDMQPHILQDFTHDRYQIRSVLDEERLPGFSEVNLYDAVAFTLDRMKDVKGRKAMLVIATGCDTFSKLTLDQALKIVKSSDTPIYPVSIFEFLTTRYGPYVPCGPGTGGFGMSLNEAVARSTFQSFAKFSGGQAYFPRFEQDLPDVYRQIAGQLRTQYSLGFIPSNPTHDGKYHKLKVDLVDEQGNPLRITDQKGKLMKYRVVAREGYYAPKS